MAREKEEGRKEGSPKFILGAHLRARKFRPSGATGIQHPGRAIKSMAPYGSKPLVTRQDISEVSTLGQLPKPRLIDPRGQRPCLPETQGSRASGTD